MDLTQLHRRASAEGLPSIPVMLATIERVSARFRTNGVLGRNSDLDLSNVQMRSMLTEMTTYGGAFLYVGEWADSPEVGRILAPVRHWANEYDHSDRYRSEYQAYLDGILSAALVINYGCQTRADNLYTARYQKDDTMWLFVSGFCRQTQISERSGLFLPTGIFQAVAAELGVELTPTYREWFDFAVETYSA